MRRAILWFHRWTGIILALYLCVIGISGGALVFQDEAAASFRVPVVSGASGPLLDVDTVVSEIRHAFPGMHLHTLYWPENSASPWFAEVKRGEIGVPGEDAFAVYLHPTTGQILHVHDYGRSVWRWLQIVHINLLTGRAGRAFNSTLALACVFSMVTGLFVWWPRRPTKALWSIRWAAGPKRLIWELHQVAGIYSLVFLMTLCLTGAYFGYRAPVHRAIARIFPMEFLNKPLRRLQPVAESDYLPVSRFLASVREQVPSFPVTRVIFPEQPNQPIRFVVYEGSHDQFYKASSLFYHPATGELLRADLLKDQLIGDRIVNWIGVVHFGAFGSIIMKCVWGVGALAFPFLAFTGVIVFLNRRRGGTRKTTWTEFVVSESSIPAGEAVNRQSV